MSDDSSENKKPLLSYSEHLERAELIDAEEYDSMPPRKRKSGKRKVKKTGRKKGGVRIVKGRISIKGKKYLPSLLIKQMTNAVVNKAANRVESKSGNRKSRKGKKKSRKK